MARRKTTQPPVSKEKGQRSQIIPAYHRQLPPYGMPTQWRDADMWRRIVAHQPFAVLSREAIIDDVIDSDWSVEPRDSTQREELKSQIDYYTKLFTNTGEYEYETINEWILDDYMTVPFGGGAELGFMNDDPTDDLVWIKPLDGGTLFPTLNRDWAYGQRLKEYSLQPIFFPSHAISRIYMSPRTRIREEGWGTSPPEKIFLAIEMLSRGDNYYAKLLLDTPEAGILDLGNISKEAAETWLAGFKNLMAGIDPLKVPILYETDGSSKFISFGKPPTDMMYDRITLKYAALVCAGYGISLSDIGLQVSSSGGETLAGSIRQERRSKRSGKSRARKKMTSFWNKMLPENLFFSFVDFDEEGSVAKGRALLSATTAFAQAIKDRVVTPDEERSTLQRWGFIPQDLPEKVPEYDWDSLNPNNNMNNRVGMLGTQVPPSSGGQGEIRESQAIERSLQYTKETLGNQILKSLSESENIELQFGEDDWKELSENYDNLSDLLIPINNRFAELSDIHLNSILDNLVDLSPELDIYKIIEDNTLVSEITAIFRGIYPTIKDEIMNMWLNKSEDYRRKIEDDDGKNKDSE